MTAAFTAVIALIEQLLPLVTAGGNAGLIGTIINVLTKWLPLIVTEVETLYEPVKNIIAALSSSTAVTPEQVATLKQLDSKMDAAFEAAAVGLDPDTPAT